MQVSPEQIADWSDYVQQIKSATTREQIGKIYETIVGYDIADDDVNASFEDLQGLALDYMREVCAEFGVHVSRVGL
jgi:adenylosuccinate synthase